jgi:hypothetical protein
LDIVDGEESLHRPKRSANEPKEGDKVKIPLATTVLLEINLMEKEVKLWRPFGAFMEVGDCEEYERVWRQMLCSLFHTRKLGVQDQTMHILVDRQGDVFDALVKAVEELQVLSHKAGTRGPGKSTEEKKQELTDNTIWRYLE